MASTRADSGEQIAISGERVTIAVALGAWVERYVKPEAPPEGVSLIQMKPPIYRLELAADATVETVVQQLKLPAQELGLITYGGQRVFLETTLASLPLSDDQPLRIFPPVIGG